MNQRRHARMQADQFVPITLFGEPDITLPARIRNISGKGIGLELAEPVAPGTTLKIELEDALLLGEVIFCREDETAYYLGIELEQSLCGLGELSRMVLAFNEALAPEASGPQHGHTAINGDHQRKQQSH